MRLPVRIESIRDRISRSLFLIPMAFVLGGAALGEAMLEADRRVDDVPDRLTATVDSARNVLSVIASATLTFAGIAFSVSLLLISLSSSQYSPRVVHGLFRDPFNKRVMGVVVGTFTYCLIVLRAVRGPLEQSGEPNVPNLAVLLAVVLGIVSILSIVGFISHSAHSMDVSKILHRVAEESLEHIRGSWSDESPSEHRPDHAPRAGESFQVTFEDHGWVERIDHDALLELLAPASCMQLETAAGRFAIPQTPLCTVWPRPPAEDEDRVRRAARAAVLVGETRTMQQDATYGVRQLADVALKALSPGINDPTTAQDALFHLGAVVLELLVRSPPEHRRSDDDGRLLLSPQAVTHEDVIGLAFDEVRIASAGQPTVQIYLLEILHLLELSLAHDQRTGAIATLRRQARQLVAVAELADLPEADIERVRTAHRKRFAD